MLRRSAGRGPGCETCDAAVSRTSLRTVGQEQSRRLTRPALALWERHLAFTIARKFEILEPEELHAELTRTILNLKCRPPPGLRNWRPYLAKALHNRADSWSRRKRALAKKEFALPVSDPDTENSLSAPNDDHDLRLAFSTLWRELDPDLQQFWHLLAQEHGNQAKVARQLGKHRNTIRGWIRKIQDLLARHQLSDHGQPRLRSVRTRAPETPSVGGDLRNSSSSHGMRAAEWNANPRFTVDHPQDVPTQTKHQCI